VAGRTAAEKIIGRAAGSQDAEAGQILEATPDLALSHENTFLVSKSFDELGLDRPWDSNRMVVVLDHRTPAHNLETASVHSRIRELARRHGVQRFHDVGEGVCHQLLVERRYARPGMLVLGTDSHTTTAGAVGAFGTGIGATEMAGVWALGSTWLKVPETVKIVLEGSMQQGVCSKDVALSLASRLGPSGADYMCMEFAGEAVPSLSISSRMTLCNMAMEMGAKSALFPVDEVVREWYSGDSPALDLACSSDEDAEFCGELCLDLCSIPPMASGPHKVEAARPVDAFDEVHVDQAFIGSCTNGRLEDIESAARVLKGRRVAPGCRLIVAPASREVLSESIDRGLVKTIVEAGGVLLPPGCGPCLGAHSGVLAAGEVCISSSNRNFPGRMGSDSAEIYLASPATVAASAVAGSIADPRRYL
jgi:3-isopropylmalate/(R)-2-methylmalate dehydratase large subunit